MTITEDVYLPTNEELTTKELPISSPALKAASFHMGKYCENISNEFSLCRKELNDPRKCIDEGKMLTGCAFEFLRKVKKTCKGEFEQYTRCLDRSSQSAEFRNCRKTQAVFDKCMVDKLGIERPEFGYFCRAKVHHTNRPPPPPKEKVHYEDAPAKLPKDYPLEEPKHGIRWHWLR